MADDQEVRQIELLCKQLYEAQDATLRQEAEKALVGFQESNDTLGRCQALLDRTDSSYAQLLAATTLSRLVSKSTRVLSTQQKIDMRNYVLNYLATRSKLSVFVVQSLVSLFAKITKLGWFDLVKEEYVFRNFMVDITKFLQGPVEHCTVGVQLLSQLTCEMNQVPDAEEILFFSKHRKMAMLFRDSHLFELFQLACSLLSSARAEALDLNEERQHGLITQLLRLALNCLTFDFIGTSSEDSEELYTVEIPSSWQMAFLDAATPKLFFELYHALPPPLSALSLACLVQVASVRRSLFSNAERIQVLTNLITGVKNILENPQGLSDSGNYHEFCRILSRLKSNYQLGELVTIDIYPQTIQLIAKFTVQSLQMWQFAPNSVHYLLSLWQNMAASVPYVKTTEPHLLETYAPEVVNTYITSRLDSVAVIVRDGLEDPLDDMGMVSQQLEKVSAIARCDYGKTCALVVALLDVAASGYQDLPPTCHDSQRLVYQGQLTWLVYIIGAAIGGRMPFNNIHEHESMDSELVCRVLQLMNLTDARLARGGCEKLELAMMSFLEQFRKNFMNQMDQTQKNSELYPRLSETLGITSESTLLSVFIRKIITNLKYWAGSEAITNKTLSLLSELSVGYSCVRKLVKLEEVQFMLTHHTSEHFPILGCGASVGEMRCRSMLYTALGRLLMVDLGEDEDRFQNFMMPLTAAFESISGLLNPSDTTLINSEDAKKVLIGLARDLRGLAFAFNTRTTYMMLFEWIYPTYLNILVRGLEVWYSQPAVSTPVLKFAVELVQNRSQRLQFDVSSPNGILLFKEASSIICAYGSRILNLEVTKDLIYPMKLKGILICFSMLKAALCGNYVNFGVFRLYGDDSLDNVLNMFVKLLLSIPQTDLLDYPKLSQTYYVLLERLTHDHMSFLASLEPAAFLYILATISDGLMALDTTVCTGCCTTLDHIVTYLFKQLTQKSSAFPVKNQLGRPQTAPEHNAMFLEVMQRRPEILQQLLTTILNVIMFDECRNQWSMSRPLLGLILLNEDHFRRLRASIVAAQPREQQAAMDRCFTNLMDSVERNLLTKNKDKFTQNLSIFRKEVNESLRDPNTTASVTDMMTS
ncbi:ran-binding protein 16 isoform X2 [Arctopsyche grandis]|uniref:ran-binding protein 16 isoform X2 n=1 Tax=Arctopsyche grandis TaxID=121162 RepID=UPI00406D6F91